MNIRDKIMQQATGYIPLSPPYAAPRVPHWGRAFAFVVLGIVAALTWFAAWRMGNPPPRSAEVAPIVAPSTVYVVTATPPPGVILYSSILAATPDSHVHHGYTLMCKGEIREYAGLDALRAAVPTVLAEMGKRRGKAYTEADCKCIQPYYEGDGHRECGLH